MSKPYKEKKRGKSKFAKLDKWFLDVMADVKLSCGARAVLVELIIRFNGKNNGEIYLPTREAASRLSIDRGTASRYFKELEAKGFIVAVKPRALGFDGKGRAAEYRLTHLTWRKHAPTRDFEKFRNPDAKCGNP